MSIERWYMKCLPVKVLTVCFGLLLPLVACQQDQYELGKDSNGRTVRLNKKTGETWVLKGNKYEKVGDAKAANTVTAKNTPKRWRNLVWPEYGIDSITLVTSEHRFDLRIYPVPIGFPTDASGKIALSFGYPLPTPLTLLFYDSDGIEFETRRITKYKRIIGTGGEVIGLASENTYFNNRILNERGRRWSVRYQPSR